MLSHSRPFWPKKRKKSSAGWIVIIFWYMMEKNWCWIHGEGRRGGPTGATHTVLFSHSRKLAHSRGGIVLYRWNYFARKKTGSSMICVPSQILLCRALCGATTMSRKMGMALLVKGQPSVPEHRLKAFELGFEILKSVDDKFQKERY